MSSNRRCPFCTLHHRDGRPMSICNPLASQRWPLQPLLDAIRDPNPILVVTQTLGHGHNRTVAALESGLSDAQADRWAVRLGFHPSLVWPEWFDAALTLRDRRMLEGGWRQAWEYAGRDRSVPNRTEAAA